jgi:hypothetical protein
MGVDVRNGVIPDRNGLSARCPDYPLAIELRTSLVVRFVSTPEVAPFEHFVGDRQQIRLYR